MNNCDSSNKISCEYYVSMGKPGSLIIKAPVILSNIKLSIPITTKLSLGKEYIDITDNTNKISLTTLKVVGNNELIIKGSISKTLKYSFNRASINSNATFNIEIPINGKTYIDFDQIPINNNIDFKLYYQKNSQPIYCELDHVKIIQDIITKKNNSYTNDLNICFHISLIQVQNVFIPEPDGNVFVLQENSDNFILSKPDFKDEKYIIGFNPNKGLIAKKI